MQSAFSSPADECVARSGDASIFAPPPIEARQRETEEEASALSWVEEGQEAA